MSDEKEASPEFKERISTGWELDKLIKLVDDANPEPKEPDNPVKRETQVNMQHFDELRSRINARLEEIRAPHRRAQIDEYPWLYGALGEVPSGVMFLCENPSLGGVKRAHGETVDRRAPDIDAQWWGGATNPAAKRFRVALHRLGLKTSEPRLKGGWRCYITNVIKEMNVAGDHATFSKVDHRNMARVWAPILTWELSQVQPENVFCVGGRANDLVSWLLSEELIPPIRPKVVNHYSARSGDANIIAGIVDVVEESLRRGPHRAG